MRGVAVVGLFAVLAPVACTALVSTDGLSGGGGGTTDAATAVGDAARGLDGAALDATTTGAAIDAGGGCRRVRAKATCDSFSEPSYDPTGVTGAAAESTAATEVIVVSQYEPPAGTGKVDVLDRRSGPHVLFLTSYATTKWNVTVTSPGALRHVFVSGYESSTVAVPDGVEIDNLTPRSLTSPTPQSSAFAKYVASATGSPWTVFAGCYRATGFEIVDDCR